MSIENILKNIQVDKYTSNILMKISNGLPKVKKCYSEGSMKKPRSVIKEQINKILSKEFKQWNLKLKQIMSYIGLIINLKN